MLCVYNNIFQLAGEVCLLMREIKFFQIYKTSRVSCLRVYMEQDTICQNLNNSLSCRYIKQLKAMESKKKKFLSTEEKAAIGGAIGWALLDSVLPSSPPKNKSQINSLIEWLGFWLRYIFMLFLPLYGTTAMIGRFFFGLRTDLANLWGWFITFIIFVIFVSLSNITMYAYKQYLSILVIDILLIIFTVWFTDYLLAEGFSL